MSDTQTSTAEFGRREEPPKPAVAKTASEALRPEKGTPPPVRRSRASRSQIVVFMNFLVSLVILAVVAAGLLVYFGRQAFFAPGPTTAMRTDTPAVTMGTKRRPPKNAR